MNEEKESVAQSFGSELSLMLHTYCFMTSARLTRLQDHPPDFSPSFPLLLSFSTCPACFSPPLLPLPLLLFPPYLDGLCSLVLGAVLPPLPSLQGRF